jgi:hypothetical protein
MLKEPSMISFIRPLILFLFCAALLDAAAIPKAADDPALNLQHYLAYRMDGKIKLTCQENKAAFRCVSHDQKIVETDNNATTTTAFKNASLHFNGALAEALQKARFDAAMKELEQTEQLRRKYIASKKPYLAPPSSPLQDALDRAIFGNLEALQLDGLDVATDSPRTRIGVQKLSYVNAMKRTAKGAAFSERIFGEISLTYTDAVVETDESDSFYRRAPHLLETWLDTNDTARADYVGRRLGRLYAEQMHQPFSGRFTLKTRYLGNDGVGIDIAAENGNRKGDDASFAFAGELRNASTVFTPARTPRTPGAPDFLFGFFRWHGSADGTPYRALLKNDKRFAGYIAQYDTLIRAYFDKKLQKFAYNAVISGWIKQAKNAFSASITGKADTFDFSVKNRDGMTAMQVFGMLMQQLTVGPNAPNAAQPDPEKIIADTAAAHLEVKIEAH